jgi:hypothetical protein
MDAGHPSDDHRKVAAFASEWVAAFSPEGWPPSARKGGRLHVGIPGRIRPEYASGILAGVHRSLAVHLFEAGQATLAQAARLGVGKGSGGWTSSGSADHTWDDLRAGAKVTIHYVVRGTETMARKVTVTHAAAAKAPKAPKTGR